MKLPIPIAALAVIAAAPALADAAVAVDPSRTTGRRSLVAPAVVGRAKRAIRAVAVHHRKIQQRQRRRRGQAADGLPDDFDMDDLQGLLDEFGGLGGDGDGDGDGDSDFDLDSLLDELSQMGGDVGDLGDDVDLESLLDEFGNMGGGDVDDANITAIFDEIFGDMGDIMGGDVGDGSGLDEELDLGALFGDGDGSSGGGMDMDLSGFGGIICSFMAMMNNDPAMKETGTTCDCAADSDLVLTCTSSEEVCDIPPPGGEGGDNFVEFCVQDSEVVVTIPLDMSGEDEEYTASTSVCSNYTAPALMADKRFCFDADITLPSMEEMVAMGTTSEAETEPNLAEMISCTASIDGEECETCSICDEGMGLELDCPGLGLLSESCTDVMIPGDSTSTTGGGDNEAASPVGALPIGGETAVVRFAKAQDMDSSTAPATSSNIQLGAVAGVSASVLAIAALTG